jgi:hypothetical protein
MIKVEEPSAYIGSAWSVTITVSGWKMFRRLADTGGICHDWGNQLTKRQSVNLGGICQHVANLPG